MYKRQGDDDSSTAISVDKQECKELFKDTDDPAVDKVTRELEADDSSAGTLDNVTYGVDLKKAKDPSYTTDFGTILEKCGDLTLTLTESGERLPVQVHMERLTVSGVDGDYNGVAMTGTFDVSGIQVKMLMNFLLGVERGVSFQTTYVHLTNGSGTVGDEVNNNLVNMFNKQRTRISSAD